MFCFFFIFLLLLSLTVSHLPHHISVASHRFAHQLMLGKLTMAQWASSSCASTLLEHARSRARVSLYVNDTEEWGDLMLCDGARLMDDGHVNQTELRGLSHPEEMLRWWRWRAPREYESNDQSFTLTLLYDILADITGVSRELLSYVRQTGGEKNLQHTPPPLAYAIFNLNNFLSF